MPARWAGAADSGQARLSVVWWGCAGECGLGVECCAGRNIQVQHLVAKYVETGERKKPRVGTVTSTKETIALVKVTHRGNNAARTPCLTLLSHCCNRGYRLHRTASQCSKQKQMLAQAPSL